MALAKAAVEPRVPRNVSRSSLVREFTVRPPIGVGLSLASGVLLLAACGTSYYGYGSQSYYRSPYERCYGPYQPSYCFPTFSGAVVIAGTPR